MEPTASFILFTIITIFVNLPELVSSSDSYGPYTLDVQSAEVCDQEKQTTHTHLDIFFGEPKSKIGYNFTVLEEVGPVAVKLKVYKWDGKKYVQSLQYSLKTICELLEKVKAFPRKVNADENCVFRKDNYYEKGIDLDTFFHKLFGEKFFYAKFRFHMKWFSKKVHIMCIDSYVQIIPK